MNTIEEFLEDAYKNYEEKYWELDERGKIEYGSSCYIHDANEYNFETLSKEEFINKVKTDSEFAKQWGVQVETRELSLEERVEVSRKKLTKEEFYKYGLISPFTTFMITYWLNQHNIPTKVITITYNNQTIEIYE